MPGGEPTGGDARAPARVAARVPARAAAGSGSGAAARVRARAYPWDVVGDDAFPDRVRDLGVGAVAVAAAYHSVRAATPWHPSHRLVRAPHAALYRPVDPAAWSGRRLVPAAAADFLPASGPAVGRDPFGAATAALTRAGIDVAAWLVLTHASRLGEAVPAVTVINCFGERYLHALCPAQAEVREYAATLAAEAVRDLPIGEVCLEACGQLGIGHADHHDKTAGAFGTRCARLLSVCCCPACRRGWRARGLDPGATVLALRAAACRLLHDDDADSGIDAGVLDAVLAARAAATTALRREVIAALRETRPGVRVVLHGHPDPWRTGAAPGLGQVRGDGPGADAIETALGEVAEVVLPCWGATEESVTTVRAARRLLPARVRASGYVTVLPPATAAGVTAHVRALRDAGIDAVDLYHLGLAGPVRWPLVRAAVQAAG